MGGNNALLYACTSDHHDVINYLIYEAGAEINVMNDYKVNMLILATKKSNVNVLEMLIKQEVDLSLKDKSGCNCLHIASN